LKEDNFVHIPFTSENLDLYVVRTSILQAVNWLLPQVEGKLLDVGCGQMPYRQYILDNSKIAEYVGVDIQSEFGYHEKVKPDHFWDGNTLPFPNDSYETIFCTEVLEHVPDTLAFLKEVYRVLKPNGIFFFTTPFLWPLHDVPYDEFRLTPFSMKRFFELTGFISCKMRALGGWHVSMAQMLGLWVNRSMLADKKRKLLRPVVKIVMKKLIAADKTINKKLYDNTMISGIYGIGKK